MLPPIFVLAPALVLLLGAAILLLLQLFRTATGNAWFVAALSVLAAWGLALFTRFRLPMQVDLPGWQEISSTFSAISFTADRLSWPMETALITLVLGVIFTDSARYIHLTRAGVWASSLALTALGCLACLAFQPLVLILAWTAMDMVEVVFLVSSANDPKMLRQAIVALGYKIAGTVAILGVILSNPEIIGDDPTFRLSIQASVALLAGAAFRLGALPLHPPFYRDLPMRRGLGTILRLAPAASTLVFLTRYTTGRQVWASTPAVLIFLAVSALYGAWMWLRSDDELAGRPFWIIAVSSLAISCSLRVQSGGVIAWGAVLILAGGLLFLFSAREPRFLYLPILGLIGFSGLPFTPAASAWAGLTGLPIPGLAPVYILSQAFLILGYYRKMIQPGDSVKTMERWVSLIYPLGLLGMGLILLLMGVIGWPGSRTVGVWWAAAASLLLAASITILPGRIKLPNREPGSGRDFTGLIGSQIKSSLQRILEFDWLNRILLAGYNLLSRFISRIAFLLEGDAGILWTLVLLALFLTVLNVGGGR